MSFGADQWQNSITHSVSQPVMRVLLGLITPLLSSKTNKQKNERNPNDNYMKMSHATAYE